MRNWILLAAGAAALLASPASAETGHGFVGPRGEVRLGWDRGTLDFDVAALNEDDEVVRRSREGGDSGLGFGAEIGYDFPLGERFIAGPYAGVDFATTKECWEVFGDDEGCARLGRNFSLGARLGAVVTPRAMLYVKAGYSNGRVRATYENEADDFDTSDGANRDGFHIGLGGELAVGSKAYLKAEYVRTNYNDHDLENETLDLKVDTHRDQLLFGAGLRF